MSLSCSSGSNFMSTTIHILSAPSSLLFRQSTQTLWHHRKNPISRRVYGESLCYQAVLLIYCTPLSSPPLDMQQHSELTLTSFLLPLLISCLRCTSHSHSVHLTAHQYPTKKCWVLLSMFPQWSTSGAWAFINNSEYNQGCVQTFRTIENFFIILSIPILIFIFYISHNLSGKRSV